jgi:hypothetical protein
MQAAGVELASQTADITVPTPMANQRGLVALERGLRLPTEVG